MNTSRLQLRALLARRQRLTEEQHARLARRIHDEISQKLTLLALQMSLETSDQAPSMLDAGSAGSPPEGRRRRNDVQYNGLRKVAGIGPASPFAEKCKAWTALVLEIGQVVREITDILQPKVVEEFGLVAGLQWYANSLNESVRCTFTPPEREVVLPPGVGRELFGICWEVTTSVFRPENTSDVDIQVRQTHGTLTIKLHGNDKGCNGLGNPERELDVMSVSERLLRLGGTVTVSRVAGSGTTITLCLSPRTRGPVQLPPVGPKIYAQSAGG
jgi:signal transduction histidine kinase